MDRCPSCGSEVREDQVICVKCGVQLRALKVEREWEGEGKSHWYIWVIVPVVLSFIVMMLVMFALPMFGG